jgi:hypothetical protein
LEESSVRLSLFIAVIFALAPGAWAFGPVAPPPPWSAPLTPDGVTDLQGVWSNASMTKLTRPAGAKALVVTPQEAKARAAAQARYMPAASAPSAPTAGAPAAGRDPGGYNAFWLDQGGGLGRVNGEFRTSWIVDPADGQLPLSDQGRALVAKAETFARLADTPVGPEALEPWDRCLISSRGSGGPGMLNNIYNSNYEIVQTKAAVAILVEMIHDVRVIPLFPNKRAAEAAHGPGTPWLGDSVGWWEGSALMVETVHVNAEQGRAGPIYLTPQGRVTERFQRVAPTEIAYAFEVEDPTYYTRPWRAEMTLHPAKGQLYEYACHEGNYAMTDILRGARLEERKTAAPPSRATGAPPP